MDDDDRTLVTAARAGDRAALEQLLRRHQPAIHAVCLRILGNPADALDATQDALLSIVRSLDRFDGRAALSTWIYRIATNASLDELRRRGRRPVAPLPDPSTGGRELAAPAQPVADGVADHLAITDALARVPEEFRVAVVLRDVADLDYATIAAILEVPPGTVRSRIARGRRALARQLDGNPAPTSTRPSPRP